VNQKPYNPLVWLALVVGFLFVLWLPPFLVRP
jgi:hypothetical protein